MPFYGRTLVHIIGKSVLQSEYNCSIVIIGLLSGLSFLHSKGMSHRDLKPPNVLIEGELVVKICDFGLSGCPDSVCGTPGYVAPEALDPKNRSFSLDQQKKADCWVMGKIIFEVLMNKVTEEDQD